MSLKEFLKPIFIFLHIPVTKNISYDIYTRKILRKCLKPGSNCMDIGCFKGEIMDDILHFAPQGRHYAFEPLPHLYKALKQKYRDKNVNVRSVALFDHEGTTTFNYVVNAPAYSGIKKRRYDIPNAEINELKVETDLLDHIIPENFQIDFIKIDVEGAEFSVLKGGFNTIRRCKPVIIFEFGLGAADYYGDKPEQVFNFLTKDCGLVISTPKGFLNKRKPLQEQEFCDLFNSGKEYYFVAFNSSAWGF